MGGTVSCRVDWEFWAAAAAAAETEVEFRADLMDECDVVTEGLLASLSFNRETISYNVWSTQSAPLQLMILMKGSRASK